jgi:branched-chain amino acid transport system ATP-binding protein
MAPLLAVEDLEIRYGDVPVIRGLTLTVEPGKLVAMVGSNSAGKSTLLNCISGLLRAQRGRILFDGEDIASWPTHRIVQFGLVQVPEARELFPDMSVRDNVLTGALFGKARASRQERMRELLDDVFPQLTEKLDVPARTLSGGQQQMVAIMRALMSRPKLLMLDEPSFGLAPRLVRELLGVVQSLNRLGVTILLVEQNVRQSLSICDVGYVLENGRVAMEGTGVELLSSPHMMKSYLGL